MLAKLKSSRAFPIELVELGDRHFRTQRIYENNSSLSAIFDLN